MFLNTLCLLALVTSACAIEVPENVVNTKSGQVIGIVNERGRIFRGIPYARPPMGDLRWDDPQPVIPWRTPLNATVDGPACIQKCKLPPLTCPPVTSEDCLSVNVLTPTLSALSTPQPVMVTQLPFHKKPFL